MDINLMERTTQPEKGKEPSSKAGNVSTLNLRPAFFAGYQDLSKLRYDYPLVLTDNIGIDGDSGDTFVRSLSGIINGVLQKITEPGVANERTRKHVLALEEAMRGLASHGTEGSLAQLWDMAEKKLVAETEKSKQQDLLDSLNQARQVLDLEGDVIDCNGETPVKVLTHAWNLVQSRKRQHFESEIAALIQNLRDILEADFVKSDEGRAPEALKDSIGAAYENVFDFKAFSQILGSSSFEDSLPERRRQRICAALTNLETLTFFATSVPDGKTPKQDAEQEAVRGFVFEDCTQALDAFQKRLPQMVALVKAMSMATLEIENRYRESKHDAFFDEFDADALGPEDLTLFPSYLVCLRDQHGEAIENGKLIEVLTSSLPIKVLVQSDDILGDTLAAPERAGFGTAATLLAGMAVGLNSAYVLQASSANLHQMRTPILKGLTYSGPALFSIFSGSADSTAGLPPYLVAAAATQARAFPSFNYDPAAGGDWASRFHISDNPQADADWPSDRFCYEDRDQQTYAMDLAFTFADFAACDRRYAGHFIKLPATTAQENVIALQEHLNAVVSPVDETPYIPMIGADFTVHKVSVSEKIVHATRCCADKWRSLQELGGVNNSHARRLLDQERETWTAEKEDELAALRQQLEQKAESPSPAEPPALEEQASPVAQTAQAAPAEAETAEAAVPPGEPYIDTARCTTCNECTDINNKLFAYNDDKQAYIADINAGTYRQLVEAAENCQVSIIHPGLPKNSNEPNLDELIARAEPFN